jgi:hypothetical protein
MPGSRHLHPFCRRRPCRSSAMPTCNSSAFTLTAGAIEAAGSAYPPSPRCQQRRHPADARNPSRHGAGRNCHLRSLSVGREVDPPSVQLRPALTLKAVIVHLKCVPAGTAISYGSTYRTPGPHHHRHRAGGLCRRLPPRLSNKGIMLVGGMRVPIVGRVCMDLTMIDVGQVPGVQHRGRSGADRPPGRGGHQRRRIAGLRWARSITKWWRR